ncbi:MAG: carboxypeptidase-like regulatory domain-containing protein, partial [Lutibacter sp.]|nr:carboxypeptidase-like regulatory domain-containing protein [Lutibacter sp.]
MKSYILILLTGLSLFAHAQQKVSGIITNSQNKPLLGVEVYIEDLQKGTSTTKNGHYELTNLPSTSIKITVTYIGFETQTKT